MSIFYTRAIQYRLFNPAHPEFSRIQFKSPERFGSTRGTPRRMITN